MMLSVTIAWLTCLFSVTSAQAQPVRNGDDLIWADPGRASISGLTLANGGLYPETRTLLVGGEQTVANDDEAFLEMVQRATFDFFWFEANPANGLVRDRSTTNSPASIAAVGFGLSALTVGIDRGWITREEGRDRVLTALRFFWNAPQSTATDATGYRGFFYHFLDMQTGRRAWRSELSTVDTALLIAGVLHMRQYFSGESEAEAEIRTLADAIYERIDWQWAQARPPAISHGWYPDPAGRSNADLQTGFIRHDWLGYNEAMILYVLALGSPTHPVGPEAWDRWVSGYGNQWQTHYGFTFLTFPPLFGHQYSHVWIDFRGLQDSFMREKGIDYFENSRRATLAQRAYHIANPRGWPNYGPDEWGLTASDTPTGYAARGAPPAQNDDGTLVPTAPGGSIAFTPDESTAALRHMYQAYGTRLFGKYGFRDAYNASVNWFDPAYLGIDQGPILLMIENLRSEAIWEAFMGHEAIQRGLQKAGFQETTSAEQDLEDDYGTMAVSLYPNPASSHAFLRIRVGRAGPVQIEIFDALGRNVAPSSTRTVSAGMSEIMLSIGRIAPGVYFVRVGSEGTSSVRTFGIVR